MWEFELVSDRKGGENIQYIQENLREPIKSAGAVLAVMADKNFIYLSIGARDEVTPEIKTRIRLLLCDVYSERMKYDHLKVNLDLPDNREDLVNTFLKVCTYFDRETERQIILNVLELKERRIHLQSFLYFRLQGLIKKWQELCDLVNQNSVTILKQDNFIELLKFLLNNIDSKCKSVILELKDRCLIYKDERSNFNMIKSIKYDNNYDILSTLIDLNPYLIKVHAQSKDSEIVNLIRSVFDDRVKMN